MRIHKAFGVLFIPHTVANEKWKKSPLRALFSTLQI